MLLGAPGTIPAHGDRPAEEFTGDVNLLTTLLDPVAGRRVRGFDPLPGPPRTGRTIAASAASPDGRTLWVAYSTSEIVGFEVATGKPRRTLTGHRGYVGGLALSTDGRRMLSAGHDSTALVWDVSLAGAAPPRREPLTEAGAEKLSETAAGSDPRAAFAAMAELATAPDRAVAVLRRQVKPAPAGPSAADVDRIFADLDSPKFAVREAASKELRGFGESAVPAVRQALEKAPPLEVRLRADAFLRQFDPAETSPARVRQVRAVELLEAVGTPAAKGLLAELAAGAASAPLTLDAAAALKRLAPGR